MCFGWARWLLLLLQRGKDAHWAAAVFQVTREHGGCCRRRTAPPAAAAVGGAAVVAAGADPAGVAVALSTTQHWAGSETAASALPSQLQQHLQQQQQHLLHPQGQKQKVLLLAW